MTLFHHKMYATIKQSLETQNAKSGEKHTAHKAVTEDMQKSEEQDMRLKVGETIVCKTKDALFKHIEDLCRDDYVICVNFDTYTITIQADEKQQK